MTKIMVGAAAASKQLHLEACLVKKAAFVSCKLIVNNGDHILLVSILYYQDHLSFGQEFCDAFVLLRVQSTRAFSFY